MKMRMVTMMMMAGMMARSFPAVVVLVLVSESLETEVTTRTLREETMGGVPLGVPDCVKDTRDSWRSLDFTSEVA